MLTSHVKLGKSIVAGLLLISLGLALTSCLGSLFNRPPEAVLTLVEGRPYGPAPQTFVFDISKSHDPDGKIVSFTLDFGDGSAPLVGNDLSTPISHVYEKAGTYIVTLTVVDNKGKSDSVNLVFGLSAPSD